MKTYALSILLWLACSVTAAAAPTLSLAPDRTWIPTKDNTCDITVNLTGAPANSTVTFQLISTNWPGYCMNAYDRGTSENPTTPDKSPDLRFVEASQSSHAEEPTSVALTWQLVAGGTEGPAIEVSWGDTPPTSLKVNIRCYDYGAIGKVNAGLYNGADASGSKQYVLAETMIPYSTNSNYIADEQEKQAGWVGWSGTNEEDSENGPTGNTHLGDGLTAFEEYRGFEVKGVHTRTSPLKKDAFVHTELPEYGIGWASKLPDIFALHLIDETEHSQGNSRRINHLVCLPFYLLGQKAIWVRKLDGLRNNWEDAFGVARGMAPTQGPVRMVEARIYVNIIRNALTNHKDKDYDTQVNKTIGHEIAHHFNLPEVVPRVGIGNFRFVWENDPLPDVDFSDLTSPQSVMRQGLYGSDSDTFPTYHNPQYYVKPDTLKSGERTTGGASRLPDFDADFDAANTRSPTNSPNGEGDDDAAPGAPQAPSQTGCGGSPYCNDAGRCSSLGNASQSTCGKASCFCSGHASPAAPSASCGTRGVSTAGREVGLHGCNNQGACAVTGHSGRSSCARSGCVCRPTPIPDTGCGGGAYCNDRGSCSSVGNASQSACRRASCFCTGHAAPTAPSASCGTRGVSTAGREAGLHGCNNQGACAVTGHSGRSSCARSCACRPTPIPTTGCGGGAYCNDRGNCSSVGNASQSACRRNSCFCSGHASPTAPSATCGTNYRPTSGREAGLHGCNDSGACAVTGHSGRSSCARSGCACGASAADTTSSGNNTSTPPVPPAPPAPPSSSGNNTSTLVRLPCGHLPTASGSHAYVPRCTTPNGRGAQCTNTSGYYECTPHEHTYPQAPVPQAPPCGVHAAGATGNHARVVSCAVRNRAGARCTNTNAYYACTPHTHTYPPPMHPCGRHQRTTSGNHAWVSTCPVPDSHGQTCTNTNGYYACTPHTHKYPVPVRPCRHLQSAGGNHSYIRCPSRQNGYQCTGYRYACRTHEHTYPAVRRCGHLQSSGGNHSYIRCPSRQNGYQCTGYRYACRTHEHTYPAVRRCGHLQSSGGNHSYIRCPSRQNGYQCIGYRYACQTHTHTYPRVRPCGHSYSSGGNHARVSCPRNAAGDVCSSGNYYVCRSHTHAYPTRRPCRHLQSASGNHTYGRCTTRQNGAQCAGYRYACKTHTHTYRRPCGHLQSASGNHSHGRCTTTRNGQRCAGSRYGCKSHRHTYPTSSGNNSSGNNSSSNNSSGNNSSGNNSSGNNSSSVQCGNTWPGSSACSSGGYAPTRTSHRTTCRRGHTYWGCNPNAARWHSRH